MGMNAVLPDISLCFKNFLETKGIDAPACPVVSHYLRHTAGADVLCALLSEYSKITVYNSALHGAGDTPGIRLLMLKKRARFYLRHGVVVLARRGRRMIIGIIDPVSINEAEISALSVGFIPEYVLITPQVLEHIIEDVFSSVCQHKATELLRKKMPFYSACRPVRKRRRILAASSVALAPLTFPLWDMSVIWTALYALGALCYISAFGTKLAVFICGWLQRRKSMYYAAVPEADLPVYSILVPVYKEPDILPQLTTALTALDYPPEKLDIVIIAEEDDSATRAAFAVLDTPAFMRMIPVPPSQPRTKPKACNYVLPLLRGQYAVIYDAEDIPHPQQLREAAAAFAGGNKRNVTYQAPLNFYNGNRNLLTRWFALEYAGHFEFMLHGIATTGIPLPLGGTSNHFDYDILTRAGGWDPFNVTEDADLGIRFYARRKQAGVLLQGTMEEAPDSVHAWICQRSRWIKGHMQTALVHSRTTNATLPRIGWQRFLGMHAFLTLPIICYILAPLLLLLGGIQAGICAADLPVCEGLHQGFWLEAAAAMWPAVYLAQCLISACSLRYTVLKPGLKEYIAILFSPCYWILHCIAAYKALWQLITKPYYWEKTTHGSRFKVRV